MSMPELESQLTDSSFRNSTAIADQSGRQIVIDSEVDESDDEKIAPGAMSHVVSRSICSHFSGPRLRQLFGREVEFCARSLWGLEERRGVPFVGGLGAVSR